MTKPWESKHYRCLMDRVKKEYKEFLLADDKWDHFYDGREECLDLSEEIRAALQKDWEEQQKDSACAQTAEKEKSGHQKLFEKEYGQDYWFEFRDSIYDVGKPTFSIISNGEDENPNENIIRISDCDFDVLIDVWGEDRKDSLERAEALCKVLNAKYPFHDTKKAESFTSLNWISVTERLPEESKHVLVLDKDEGLCIGYYYLERWSHHPAGDFATGAPLFHVTKWMFLPKPPEDE